jgi:PAS domain S-box-containing protein
MIELAQNAGELSDAFEKLVQEAARLQTVIDTVPSFLWTSLPDGSKEYLNKRWYEYTGLSLEEGKGWGWKVVVHPDDLDRLIREWLALVDARKPGELETRIRRYDGEYRWFLIRIVPQLDAEGNVVRWFGSNTDIEDRKRAEKKLLEEERELRRITDATANHCRPGRRATRSMRPGNARHTGLTMEDVVTSDFRASIFHPEDVRGREERKAGLARGLPFEIEQRAPGRGRYRWLFRYNRSTTNRTSGALVCNWNRYR